MVARSAVAILLTLGSALLAAQSPPAPDAVRAAFSSGSADERRSMLVLLKVFPGTLSEPATHLILREELRTVTSHQQPAPTQEQYFADLIDAVAAAANDDDLALLAGIDHVNAIGALIKPMTAPFPVSSTP